MRASMRSLPAMQMGLAKGPRLSTSASTTGWQRQWHSPNTGSVWLRGALWEQYSPMPLCKGNCTDVSTPLSVTLRVVADQLTQLGPGTAAWHACEVRCARLPLKQSPVGRLAPQRHLLLCSPSQNLFEWGSNWSQLAPTPLGWLLLSLTALP